MIIDTKDFDRFIGKDLRKVSLEDKLMAQKIEEIYMTILRPAMIDANGSNEDWRIQNETN